MNCIGCRVLNHLKMFCSCSANFSNKEGEVGNSEIEVRGAAAVFGEEGLTGVLVSFQEEKKTSSCHEPVILMAAGT